MSDRYIKEYMWKENKHMKKIQHHQLLLEMSFKTTMRYHYIPFKMVKKEKQNLPIPSADVDVELELSHINGRSAKWYRYF